MKRLAAASCDSFEPFWRGNGTGIVGDPQVSGEKRGSKFGDLSGQIDDQTPKASQLGKIVLTSGVDSLPSDVRAMVIRKVATFVAFTGDDDPYGEHDCGNFEVAGQKFFFKIDYYDPNLEFGSEDPGDPQKTTRVLTIMLAEEY
jgi:hypothetical protein